MRFSLVWQRVGALDGVAHVVAQRAPGSGARKLGAVAVTLFLTACQSAAPVEEARKVSATFAESTFVPPPRTIQDVTAILDQQMREETQALQAARALADRLPPTTTDELLLAEFYRRRGLAAFQLGRARQYLEDLTEALGHVPKAGQAGYRVRVLTEAANAESLSGDLWRQIAYLKEAVTIVPPDQPSHLVVLSSLLARRQAQAGNIPKAEAALRQAETVRARLTGRRASPTDVANWDVQLAIARAYIAKAQGRYAEAEQRERAALQILATEAGQSLVQLTVVTIRDLSGVLALQGRPLEAEVEARRALLLSLQKFGRSNPLSTTCAAALAQIVFDEGRSADAEALARRILAIQTVSGLETDALLTWRPRQVLFSALSTQGRWEEAVVEFDKADAVRTKHQLPETGFGPWPALALIKVGRVQEVVTRTEAALARATSQYGPSHLHTAELGGVLGMAHAQQGKREQALADFAAAVPILLARAGGVEEEGTGWVAADRRRTAIFDAYIRTLIEAQRSGAGSSSPDPIEEAFRMADAARGRAVESALRASSARSTTQTPALSTLIRQEQDTGKQLGALTSSLANQLSFPTEAQDPTVIATLRAQIATLTQARLTLSDRIRRDFPAYAHMVNPTPASVADVQAALRPGEALVSIYGDEDRTFVWAVPKQGPLAFAIVSVGSNALEAEVTTLRQALDPAARTLGEIPAFDLVGAYGLYHQLLEPVRPGWWSAASLMIVAHGPLGPLPFTVLPTAPVALGPETAPLFSNYGAVPWLARTHAVTILPSVASLVTLRALPVGDPSRRTFLGFGDPYFSREQAERAAQQEARSPTPGPGNAEAPRPAFVEGPADVTVRSRPVTRRDLTRSRADSVSLAVLPRLPDTADEIRSIAATLHADMSRDVFLGMRATERAVQTTDLARYRVIAFATHGLIPGDLDGLTQPALALTAPEVTGGGGDGLLKMEDILTLRMNADWVVLSACNTAGGRGAGAEAISGLGRAFFYAGARALLVSNWPVETTSARALTTELFRRQAENPSLSRAQALQQTLSAMIDRGGSIDAQTRQMVYSYAHPIFWAPFSLVGDGGAPAKP